MKPVAPRRRISVLHVSVMMVPGRVVRINIDPLVCHHFLMAGLHSWSFKAASTNTDLENWAAGQ